MKRKILILLLITVTNFAFGQNLKTNSSQLTEQEIVSIFTESLKTKLKIDYSIYRIYKYEDNGGTHYLIMTENKTECDNGKECFDSIKAFCFNLKEEQYHLEWKLKDFILPKGNEVSEEYSINFWTKYFELNDYDNDGFVDPIIVYGTYGMNGTDDGRIKIVVYHNGKKRAIRHQNGTLDFERNTKVDESYYELPIGIQKRVSQIMTSITENEHGIFPYGWQTAMKNKELNFDEN
ncbi:M949_RS01915 family surface polysaccharide biosynthesis protein [Flavobacterium sp. J27]|uniref:M949_RS01915 family surface polysaccharide biosynthesis protein n=1 Tax=Flavobacterium sp. J27 TaxID=2060419 RepID=UPI003514C008